MRKVNGRRMPSDGKSSHCLWQGELKKNKQTNNNKNKTKDIFLCEFLEHVHTFS